MSNVFEKVSFLQFLSDCLALDFLNAGDEEAVNNLKEVYDSIELPRRSTSMSAGYDFNSPFTMLVCNSSVTIPTGIRCKLDPKNFLAIVPRSSYGFKYGMRLANTVGIIDADYYFANNEGHIMTKILSDKQFTIEAGDRYVQGIIIPFDVAANGNTDNNRSGGIGSTGA